MTLLTIYAFTLSENKAKHGWFYQLTLLECPVTLVRLFLVAPNLCSYSWRISVIYPFFPSIGCSNSVFQFFFSIFSYEPVLVCVLVLCKTLTTVYFVWPFQ